MKLLPMALTGTIVTVLCCFTPLLVIILGAVGLGAAVVWLDVVLLPLLAVFVALTLYALWNRSRVEPT